MSSNQNFENLANFYFIDQIYESQSSLCLKAIEKMTGKFYSVNIIKVYKKDSNEIDQNKIKEYCRIALSWSELKHPTIQKLKGYILCINEQFQMKPSLLKNLKESSDLNGFAVFTKYNENVNLFEATTEYLNSNGQNRQKMNPTIRSKIIFGVACMMKYLHENSIGFIDLRLQKITLNEEFEPKFSDFFFDLKTRFNQEIFNSETDIEKFDINDWAYYAPELFIDTDLSFKKNKDIYAFAFFIYFMFSNVLIFKKRKIRSVRHLFMCIVEGVRPDRPDLMPDCYWELINFCWTNTISERPRFFQIVEELKNDKYAIEEFGMKTDINELHEYQQKVLI